MGLALPLPLDLNRRIQFMILSTDTLIFGQQYEQVRECFEQIYQLLLQEQPPDGRYDKADILYQLGTTQANLGRREETLFYFILAYIEDLLNQKDGEEDRAYQLPACRQLRETFKSEEKDLTVLKTLVQEKKKGGLVIQDPEVLLSEWADEDEAAEANEAH